MADPKVHALPSSKDNSSFDDATHQQQPQQQSPAPSSPSLHVQQQPFQQQQQQQQQHNVPMMNGAAPYPPAYYHPSAHFYQMPYPPSAHPQHLQHHPQQPHGFYHPGPYQPLPPGYLPPVQQPHYFVGGAPPPHAPAAPMRTYGTLQPPSSSTASQQHGTQYNDDLLAEWRYDTPNMHYRFCRMVACGTLACLTFFFVLVLMSALASPPPPHHNGDGSGGNPTPHPYPVPDDGTCPGGHQPVNCLVDPCSGSKCKYGCQADYCKGCTGLCMCKQNSHCNGTNEWCRDGLCVPYQLEGQQCGGFTPHSETLQCLPGLVCAMPPGVADASGTCRPPCSSESQCSRKEYCADSTHTCTTNGACYADSDCTQRDNKYVSAMCVGPVVCSNARCTINCIGTL